MNIKSKKTYMDWKFLKNRIKRDRVLLLLLIVPVAYILIFCYYPMYGAQIAFRDFKLRDGIMGSEWVGLEHFKTFLGSYVFFQLLRNTLVLSLYSLCTFPIPVLFAVLLHNMPNRAVKKSVQMITYAPYFISTVVLCGMVIQFLGLRDGLVNNILSLFGVEAIEFMGETEYFSSIYVWSGVWQTTGYSAIIYLSALSGVDPEMHEAAKIDGATLWQRIRHIDIPTIWPTVVIMFILRCGDILSIGHEKVFLLQNAVNYNVSEVISTYVYKQGVAAAVPQYSYSTAIGVLISVVNLIMLTIVNSISRKLSDSSLW